MRPNGAHPEVLILPARPNQSEKVGLDDHLPTIAKNSRNGHGKLLAMTKEAERPLLSQDLNEVGLAERFIEYSQGKNRYLPLFKHWTHYVGTHWPVNEREKDQVRTLMHDMIHEFINQANAAAKKDPKFAEYGKFGFNALNTVRIEHALREAQPYLELTTAELDRDPLLLNFTNGTLDARTMKLRPHLREDYITSLISHDYDPKARCPKFERFLDITFRGDRDTIQCLQRALGYSLTGDTSEKCVFLAHGPTDSGKTTLLTLISKLLSDYASVLKVSSLMVERGRPMDNNAQSDLADLRGKRFVMTSETAEGQRIREDLLKLLSQGQGEFKAVRKYENWFVFSETWKIWMDCNHLPNVQGTDDAIWNRLIVIPFYNTVPKAKQNKKLVADLLKNEAEGILAWLVRGLKSWREKGLTLSPAMKQARDEWRRGSDRIALWLADRCTQRPDAKTQSMELHKSYTSWCAANNFYAENTVIFARKMKEHGFVKREVGHDKVLHWVGLELKGRKFS